MATQKPKEPRAEKPTKNGHYMGKRCGFEYKDGRYRVAQAHYHKMEDAAQMEHGLRTMMEAQNAYIANEFQKVARLRDSFWKGIKDDYELDGSLLYHGDGWVSIQPAELIKFTCAWCKLEGFVGLDALADHQRECKEHPLAKEIKQLQKALEDVKHGTV